MIKQHKAKLYNGQVVRYGDHISFRDSDGYKCAGIIKRRDDKTLYFWNSRFDIIDYRNAKKLNIFNRKNNAYNIT